MIANWTVRCCAGLCSVVQHCSASVRGSRFPGRGGRIDAPPFWYSTTVHSVAGGRTRVGLRRGLRELHGVLNKTSTNRSHQPAKFPRLLPHPLSQPNSPGTVMCTSSSHSLSSHPINLSLLLIPLPPILPARSLPTLTLLLVGTCSQTDGHIFRQAHDESGSNWTWSW